MIYNAQHYRYLLFKKLFQSNLWNNNKMFFYVRAPSTTIEFRHGTNHSEILEPHQQSTYTMLVADLNTKFAQIEALPEYWNKITTLLTIHGWEITLSGNGIRGRAPNNVISSANGGFDTLRTLFCRPPNARGLFNNASALQRIYTNAVADPIMRDYMAANPLPAAVGQAAIDQVVNGYNIDGMYFWTDKETLTYKPISDIIATLANASDPIFDKLQAIVANRAYFNGITNATAQTAATRLAAARAALEAERLVRRAAELQRMERLEAERAAQAQAVLNNITKYADIFENTIPNRRKQGEKSIENMGNFLNSLDDLSIVRDTDDDNPLTPAVSLGYDNGALLSLISNENGVFIENVNIPQEKLLSFVKMIKEL